MGMRASSLVELAPDLWVHDRIGGTMNHVRESPIQTGNARDALVVRPLPSCSFISRPQGRGSDQGVQTRQKCHAPVESLRVWAAPLRSRY